MTSIDKRLERIYITSKSKMHERVNRAARSFDEARAMHERIEELYPYRKAVIIEY